MRTFDLTPLYRSAIGFDRLANLLEQRADAQPGYPPYNIELVSEDKYRIVMALAGGGVGGVIPGFLDLNIKAGTKWALRAGGGLAGGFRLARLASRGPHRLGDREDRRQCADAVQTWPAAAVGHPGGAGLRPGTR